MVNLMQVDMLQLGVLQTQMDNLSVQATLIIGFALSMWAGETLMPLLEDDSQLCIWKSWYHLFFASVFFIFVAVCISCCLIIVSIVSYIKQAAQEAALIVSTGAAVAVTRQHLNTLNYYFVVAYASFTLSAVLLIILYVGLPSRLPADTAVPTPARCASTHAPLSSDWRARRADARLPPPPRCMSSPQLHAVLRAHRVHCPAVPHPGEVDRRVADTREREQGQGD